MVDELIARRLLEALELEEIKLALAAVDEVTERGLRPAPVMRTTRTSSASARCQLL
jgi:hypothetical protein